MQEADGRSMWMRVTNSIGRGAAAIGLVSSPSRPASGPDSTSAAVLAADQSTAAGVPHDWIDIPSGERFKADFAFPCIGTRCAGRWCKIGTRTQGFRDFIGVHFEKDTEWQHMCAACADHPEEVARWRGLYDDRLLDRAVDASIAAAELEAAGPAEEAALDSAAPATETISGRTVAMTDASRQQQQQGTAATVTEAATEAAQSDSVGNSAATQPLPRFLSHEEERTQLGRPIWTEIKDQVPRVQHDGTLAMPVQGMSIDFKSLQRDFPRLPYVEPAPAAARAAKLLKQSADGGLTAELREKARSWCAAQAFGMRHRNLIQKYLSVWLVRLYHSVCL